MEGWKAEWEGDIEEGGVEISVKVTRTEVLSMTMSSATRNGSERSTLNVEVIGMNVHASKDSVVFAVAEFYCLQLYATIGSGIGFLRWKMDQQMSGQQQS